MMHAFSFWVPTGEITGAVAPPAGLLIVDQLTSGAGEQLRPVLASACVRSASSVASVFVHGGDGRRCGGECACNRTESVWRQAVPHRCRRRRYSCCCGCCCSAFAIKSPSSSALPPGQSSPSRSSRWYKILDRSVADRLITDRQSKCKYRALTITSGNEVLFLHLLLFARRQHRILVGGSNSTSAF